MLTHFPKWPFKGGCKICDAWKVQHTPHRKKAHGPPDRDTKPPVAFGDSGTMDHIIYSPGDHSVRKDRVALVCYDRATHWLDSFPAVANDTDCTKHALQEFYGGDSQPKKIYSDNAPELLKACNELGYPLTPAPPIVHNPMELVSVVLGRSRRARNVFWRNQDYTPCGGVTLCDAIASYSMFVSLVSGKMADLR